MGCNCKSGCCRPVKAPEPVKVAETPVEPLMEKRNVVEDKRTPEAEISRPDENWDKQAAQEFKPVPEKQ